MALSQQQYARGNYRYCLDERKKIPREQKGKQYSRPKAYGTGADQHSHAYVTHLLLPPDGVYVSASIICAQIPFGDGNIWGLALI